MINRPDSRAHECVVVDLNTQRDFCASGGAYPVVNMESLVLSLRRVIAWVKRNHVPVISSVDSHRLWEIGDTSQPVHCVDGSVGQRKLDFTVLPTRTRVEADNTLAVPFNLFKFYQQVIFPKRTEDLLANPKADRFLTQLPISEFVVVGNGVEGAVKAVVLGLLARGKRVAVVVDACGYWNKATADLALRQMIAKGAEPITVEELRARRTPRRQRYPATPSRANGQHGMNGKNGRGAHHGGVNGHLPKHRVNGSIADLDEESLESMEPGDGEV